MKLSSGLLLVMLLVAAGCGPATVSLDPVELARLRQRPEVVAVHYPPRLPFMVITRDTSKAEGVGGLFGPIGFGVGAAASVSASKELGARFISEYSLEDPVVKVKERVVSALQREASVPNIRTAPVVEPTEEVAALRKTFGVATVIDFKTITWAVWFHKDDPLRYFIAYRARVRLVRLDGSKVTWEGECGFRGQDPRRAPTLDDLRAERGALLKSRFEEVAVACGQELATRLLGR